MIPTLLCCLATATAQLPLGGQFPRYFNTAAAAYGPSRSFGNGFNSPATGILGQLGGTYTSNGFLSTNSFPMTSLSGMSTALPTAAFPMANAVLPATYATLGSATLGTATLGLGSITGVQTGVQMTKDGFDPEQVQEPYEAWEEYKTHFDTQNGVPESALVIASRGITSVSKWFTAFVRSPLAMGTGGAIVTANRPRTNTYPTANNPSRPILPCPVGTPRMVCVENAKRIGERFPDYRKDDVADYEDQYYQRLAGMGYPGFGPVERYPVERLATYPNYQVGPAPRPSATPQTLDCEINIGWEIPYNVPNGATDQNWLYYDQTLECACDSTKSPIMSQCRVVRSDPEISSTTLPPDLLPYPLMFFDGEFLANGPNDEQVEDYNPCPDFEDFDMANPVKQKCKTIVIPGFTPEPRVRFAGMQPVPQPQFGSNYARQTPFQCYISHSITWTIDSPFAWENAYDTEVSFEKASDMECACDGLANPILSTCRAYAVNNFPIPVNLVKGRRLSEEESAAVDDTTDTDTKVSTSEEKSAAVDDTTDTDTTSMVASPPIHPIKLARAAAIEAQQAATDAKEAVESAKALSLKAQEFADKAKYYADMASLHHRRGGKSGKKMHK